MMSSAVCSINIIFEKDRTEDVSSSHVSSYTYFCTCKLKSATYFCTYELKSATYFCTCELKSTSRPLPLISKFFQPSLIPLVHI